VGTPFAEARLVPGLVAGRPGLKVVVMMGEITLRAAAHALERGA
jgi:hypothetical protein